MTPNRYALCVWCGAGEKVKNFARLSVRQNMAPGFPNPPFKIIVLDEADSVSIGARLLVQGSSICFKKWTDYTAGAAMLIPVKQVIFRAWKSVGYILNLFVEKHRNIQGRWALRLTRNLIKIFCPRVHCERLGRWKVCYLRWKPYLQQFLSYTKVDSVLPNMCVVALSSLSSIWAIGLLRSQVLPRILRKDHVIYAVRRTVWALLHVVWRCVCETEWYREQWFVSYSPGTTDAAILNIN